MTDAVVRIFVPTYRRSHLLGRALRSLQAQTLPAWVAFVHNDAPDDPAPARLVAALGDPRVHYVCHERQIGGAATFNLVYREQPEEFVAVLEDDNWWFPPFLEQMVAAMRAHPDVTLAWANQHIWEEMADGAWQDSHHTVRPASLAPEAQKVYWPQPAQCFGAFHANGTMFLRSQRGAAFPTPQMDLGGTEAVRERCLPHPLLYVPESLGVFAVTRTTYRSHDPSVWATTQVLLAASFLKHVSANEEFWRDLWRRARISQPRMTGTLLLAIAQYPTLRRHLAYARPDDWRHFAIRSVRRPLTFVRLLRARRRAPNIWSFLDTHTAARATDAAAPPGQAAMPAFHPLQ